MGYSLTLFRRALSEVLLSADRTTNVGGIPTHVVDLEAVRSEFYAIYIPKGDTPEQKQDSRKHAFHRAVERAQQACLIGVRTDPAGRTLVWLATTDATQPDRAMRHEQAAVPGQTGPL